MIVVCFDAVRQGVAAPASGYGLQNIEDRLIDIFAFGDDFLAQLVRVFLHFDNHEFVILAQLVRVSRLHCSRIDTTASS